MNTWTSTHKGKLIRIDLYDGQTIIAKFLDGNRRHVTVVGRPPIKRSEIRRFRIVSVPRA